MTSIMQNQLSTHKSFEARMADTRQSALMRWRQIPYQWRVIIAMVITFVAVGASFIVSPNTEFVQYLETRTGFNAAAWGFIFWMVTPALMLGYYVSRNALVLAIFSLPLVVVIAMMAFQIFTTPDGNYFELVMAFTVLMCFPFFFVTASDIDERDEANKLLQAQVNLLTKQLQSDTKTDE